MIIIPWNANFIHEWLARDLTAEEFKSFVGIDPNPGDVIVSADGQELIVFQTSDKLTYGLYKT